MLTNALLRSLDTPGPRYTSYPTADRFNERFGAVDYEQALATRAAGTAKGQRSALSMYVHLPFCESVCYFCACNKIITRHHERAAEYLQALQVEVDLHRTALGPDQQIAQLHLGGGSPTFLSDDELSGLLQMIRTRFALEPAAEVAIEIDPRTVDRERLQRLVAAGFNRISFGVQDVDPAVQVAVHRVQPIERVQALLEEARKLGIKSVNVDLIYGLPKQTPESFARTIQAVSSLRPDRIAMYGYAHLPTRFKPQRRIHSADLPDTGQRVRMLGQAIEALTAAGYVHVGMDHFALPEDELAIAKAQGKLHRNFQGYSTRPEHDLIAIGVSAIGRVGATYSQNCKDLESYYAAMRGGRFAVVKGLALTPDDLARRSIIMALMCQGQVDFDTVKVQHRLHAERDFAPEMHALQTMAEQGLVQFDSARLKLTELGWYFVRSVAGVFDRYLQNNASREQFSRIA